MIAVFILIVLVAVLSVYSAFGTYHNQQEIKALTDVTKGIVINAKHISRILEILKRQETKWIHREDLDFKDKLGCNHFHGMCGNCGFVHDFIDDHTGQYKYCPQCGQAVKWDA